MKCDNFKSYSIDSDLLYAACSFSLELSPLMSERVNIPIEVGQRCKLFINGHLELNGFIDTVEGDDKKDSRTLRVSGRDLMGLLVDACCELSDCEALEEVSLLTAAQKMVRKLPVISRNPPGMQEGLPDVIPLGILQIEPGMKIFEILSRYASMRGLIFYSMPDGTLIFGKPKRYRFAEDPKTKHQLVRGNGDVWFPADPIWYLIRRKSGKGNNIESISYKRDISKASSIVNVVSQGAGMEGFGQCEASASFSNSDFPPKLYKPLVITQNGDLNSPAALAKLTVEKMRREMLSITCEVAGHSQNGSNWAINNFVSLIDEVNGFRGDFLIYGRTFAASKEDGMKTTLRLAKGGLA
jgi:prophage tail gpP-like protein